VTQSLGWAVAVALRTKEPKSLCENCAMAQHLTNGQLLNSRLPLTLPLLELEALPSDPIGTPQLRTFSDTATPPSEVSLMPSALHAQQQHASPPHTPSPIHVQSQLDLATSKAIC
jgi:hypothetical protein